MRVQNFSVPPQEVLNSLFYGFLTILRSHSFFVHILCSQILSKDSVTVFVNAIMYYKVLTISYIVVLIPQFSTYYDDHIITMDDVMKAKYDDDDQGP